MKKITWQDTQAGVEKAVDMELLLKRIRALTREEFERLELFVAMLKEEERQATVSEFRERGT